MGQIFRAEEGIGSHPVKSEKLFTNERFGNGFSYLLGRGPIYSLALNIQLMHRTMTRPGAQKTSDIF